MRETIYRGVPAGGRDGDHKANPRDVAMRMKGMRDSSRKARFQEWQCNPRIDKFKKSYIQYSSVLLQLEPDEIAGSLQSGQPLVVKSRALTIWIEFLVIPGIIQMERFIPVECFQRKR